MKVFFVYALHLVLSTNAAFGQAFQPADAPVSDAQNTVQHFSELTNYFHQKTDAGQISGTVILLSQGDNRWVDVYGKQQVEPGVSMAENTIFRLASMTKPITSTAIMMLVEQGKLQLTDHLGKYIPAFSKVQVLSQTGVSEALQRPITLLDLLTHTSGIANNMFQNTAAEKAYHAAFKANNPKSLGDLVELVGELPLAHQPGTGWTYSYSTDVLARVLEIVTGESIDTFFQNHIFKPLKMDDTGFQVPSEKLPRFSAAYGRQLKCVDAPDSSSNYVNGKNFARGNGGLCSTAGDYLRFCQMLLNGGELEGVRLLQPETVALMMQDHLPLGVLPETPGMPVICNGFGLGFGVQQASPILGRSGDCAWPGAYMCYFFMAPSQKAIGILMAQSTDFANLPMLGAFHQLASAIFSGAE